MFKNYNVEPTSALCSQLQALVGRQLQSYLTTENEAYASSYGCFILRFEEEDVEVKTREIIETAAWFDETNSVELVSRQLRDLSLPFSSCTYRLADGTLKEETCGFYEFPVGRQITAIGVAIATDTYDAQLSPFKGESAMGAYVRALIIYFDDDALVFDKGAESWSEIWAIQRCKRSQVQLAERTDCDIYPYIQPSTRVETFK